MMLYEQQETLGASTEFTETQKVSNHYFQGENDSCKQSAEEEHAEECECVDCMQQQFSQFPESKRQTSVKDSPS